jgi:ABC-2 type transport system ATP-binding protein
MIRVENLTYEYPGTRALDNVTFTLQRGTITALVGPNGAGKTTLLQCLAALKKPFNGRMFMDNQDILKEPRKIHRKIGYLSDFFGLYDRLSVKQALTYFAMAQKVDKNAIPARVARVISKLGLTDKTDEKIRNLSRGMRQRLAIGQAIIHDPEFIFLDEPASGLDPESRNDLSRLFTELNKSGKTLIVSSHILAELDQYANHLLILRKGKLIDQDNLISAAEKHKNIHIELLSPDDRIKQILEDDEHIGSISIEANTITFKFTGKDTEQTMLLRQLIDFGLPVKSFYEKTEGVQEQYLKTMDEIGKTE